MEIVTTLLPAAWASALINNDWSGLGYCDPQGAVAAKFWQAENGLAVLSCNDTPLVMRYDGLLTECLEYQCTPLRVNA